MALHVCVHVCVLVVWGELKLSLPFFSVVVVKFFFFPLRTYLFYLCIYFWQHQTAHGISVPQPRIEPMHPALEAWSLNHQTCKEVSLPFPYSCPLSIQVSKAKPCVSEVNILPIKSSSPNGNFRLLLWKEQQMFRRRMVYIECLNFKSESWKDFGCWNLG